MPIEEWEEPLAADENVQTSSRFVCNRIRAAARSGDEIQLQILRFMIMLLEFSRSLKHSKSGPDSAAPPGSKRLPSRDDLRAALSSTTGPHGLAGSDPSSVSDSVIDAIRRKFAPLGQYVTKTDLTLLHTTICALAFHVPPDGPVSPNELTTDTANLRDDLRLDNPVILQYFRELGCRVDKPRETEFAKWGIKTKAEGAAQRIARLRLPLEFPKVSRGGGSRRR
jgi:DNA-directed RNA polymerase I subunit RPA49